MANHVPVERLNQIAANRLAALRIPAQLDPQRQALVGELPFGGQILHPATRLPIGRARFVTVEHDGLRFLDPPLCVLPPLKFYDAPNLQVLEARVAGALQQRMSRLQELATRLRKMGLEPRLDGDRLAVRAQVKTVSHAFEMLGTPEAVRVARVEPRSGKPFEVPEACSPLVQLEEYPAAIDLELYLGSIVAELQASANAPPAPAPSAAAVAEQQILRAVPASPSSVTAAQIAKHFGPEAVLGISGGALEVSQEFTFGSRHFRFSAVHEKGTVFKGSIIGGTGVAWSDRFDATRFPGAYEFLCTLLGVKQESEPAVEAVPEQVAAPSEGAVPDQLMPHPGEVWVMNILVEASGGDEVRYVCTDIDGKPYGAARVLKRAEFENVFSEVSGGWRLSILIEGVEAGNAVYRQLDRSREPRGTQRRMPLRALVANFVPEAASY